MAITKDELRLIQRIIEIEVKNRVEKEMVLLEAKMGKSVSGAQIIQSVQQTSNSKRPVSAIAKNKIESLKNSLNETLQGIHNPDAAPRHQGGSIMDILSETKIDSDFVDGQNEDEQSIIDRQPPAIKNVLDKLQNTDFSAKLKLMEQKSNRGL